MRKFILLIILILATAVNSLAQVSVNNDGSSPNNSAMLDVKSTNKGLLPPRMTTSERNSIPSPAAGLLIFNTDCNDMQYFNGSGWIPMANQGNLATPGAVGGNASPCINSSGNTYSVGAVPNATGYHWTVPAGSTITSGQGTTTITITFGTANGVVCVAAYNECYRSLVSCLAITLTQPLPVGVTIVANVNPVCEGTQVTYSATPVNGGSNPTYQWRKNNTNITGATNSTYTYAPVNNDVITCRLTSNGSCVSGNPATSSGITTTVFSSQPVSVTIIASATTVCAGTPVNFTASPVNGGTLPAYQWRKGGFNISGATNATYSYTPVNGDAISCVLTSNTPCPSGNPATSNTINMIVNPLLQVSVSIAASSNPSCFGSSVLFTATPVNGGGAPAYQWRKGGTNISGATNVTYSYVPLNGDAISCVLTSSETCKTGSPATSNVITMAINQPQPVSVVIAANATTVCSGTQVTYTATPTNGGSNPGYQWQKGGVNISGATSSTYVYAPVNNDNIRCVMTSNAACISGNPATSNTVVMTVVSSQPVSVGISASANPVCATTWVTYTATPVNGGTTPSYQWKVNGGNVGGNTPTYSFVPSNGQVVTCVMTSNIACPSGNPAISNAINMSVTPLAVVSLTIAASANPVCAGVSVTYTSTPVNGGTAPVYQWKKNGNNIAGATNATYVYAPANGDAITCLLTSNINCATSNPALSNSVTMTVNPNLTASVSIVANANPVCAGTQVTYTATPVNGGATPAYQWKKNSVAISGATNVTYIYAPVNNDAITCTMTSNAPCVSGSPATSPGISMMVIANSPVAITISASANPVCTGASVTFSSSITNGGTAPQYQWRVNGVNRSGATNSTMSYVPADNDQVTCVLTSNVLCATGNPATSNSITMTVNPYITPDLSIRVGSSYQCGSSSVPFVAVPVNGGTAPLYQWRLNGSIVPGATNATYTPASYSQVDCQMTSNAACISGSAVVSDFLQANGATVIQNPVCYGEPIELACAALTGGCMTPGATYQWENSNGSWQSSEANPVINAGTAGYASDIFYLTVSYSPPPGGLTKGWACAVVQPLSSCVPCGSPFTVNHVAGLVAPVAKTVSYGTINNIAGETSKCWITKNLGATQQATAVSDATEASAGWYWQFNRKQGYKHDGTNRTPNTTWITSISESSDWLTANDPCNLELGTAWRLPTYTEWYNVDNVGGWVNWNGPWGSGLKLHAAGNLNSNGSLDLRGSYGIYWGSTQLSTDSGLHLFFGSGTSYMGSTSKTVGFSIRCLREN